MSMLCTLIRGQMSNTFFFNWGQMSSPVNHLGGRCPHIPFFIGGHMSEGAYVLHSVLACHQYYSDSDMKLIELTVERSCELLSTTGIHPVLQKCSEISAGANIDNRLIMYKLTFDLVFQFLSPNTEPRGVHIQPASLAYL